MGRVFGFAGTIATLAIGMYIYSLQVKTLQPSAGVASNEAAAVLPSVKNDLVLIGQAERNYFSSQGRYASFNELVSGNYVTINSERPPYFYDVETTPAGFRATATRTAQGSPAQLWITESMQIQSSD